MTTIQSLLDWELLVISGGLRILVENAEIFFCILAITPGMNLFNHAKKGK